MKLDRLTLGSPKNSPAHRFKALKAATFDFGPGRGVTALVGESGAGKSSALAALANRHRNRRRRLRDTAPSGGPMCGKAAAPVRAAGPAALRSPVTDALGERAGLNERGWNGRNSVSARSAPSSRRFKPNAYLFSAIPQTVKPGRKAMHDSHQGQRHPLFRNCPL